MSIVLFLADIASATAIATHVLLAFHMLFVNILLINLLIAMFRYVVLRKKSETTSQDKILVSPLPPCKNKPISFGVTNVIR